MRPSITSIILATVQFALADMAFGIRPALTSNFVTALPGEKVVRPQLTPSSSFDFGDWGVVTGLQVDQKTGAIRLIEGKSLRSAADATELKSKEEFVAACLTVVNAHRDSLGVTSTDLELIDDATIFDDTDQFFKFAVKRNDILIGDADFNCRFKFRKLVQIAAATFGEAPASTLVSRQRDFTASLTRLGFKVQSKLADQYRVQSNSNGYRLVLVKRYEATADGQPYTVSVRADNGKPFEVKLNIFYANLPGRVVTSYYERNYFGIAMATVMKNAKVYSGSQAIATDENGSFSAPDSAAPKLKGFDSTIVKVSTSSGTLVSTEASRSSDGWLIDFVPSSSTAKETDKDMAQSMVYFHINRIVNYAKTYIQPSWFNRTLTANANLAQTCNAYWDGSSVNFFSAGGGCANTALISDVIYHEWGHGLDANTGGISDGAFSEGFGDIMALLFTRSNVTAPGFKTDGKGIRDLAPNKIYPQDQGEVHAEGLIIGGTFYDMFEKLSEDLSANKAIELLSKYAFKGISTATKYTDMYAALKVIDDDDGNPATLSPNYCTINGAFTAHGLATADPQCR